MAWHQPGNKPLSEPMMASLHIYLSLCRNELSSVFCGDIVLYCLWYCGGWNIFHEPQPIHDSYWSPSLTHYFSEQKKLCQPNSLAEVI